MIFSNWNKPSSDVCLNEDQIHIWLVNLKLSEGSTGENTAIENLSEILSSDEIKKANKFYFEKDKKAFIVAHSSLRVILSKYLNTLPQSLLFKNNKYGKPFLELPKIENINFNLSHSKDFALIAITSSGKIGVDIEYIKEDFVSKDIALNYFSESEIIELFNLPEEKQKRGFFYCWTRKEAYIKAEGKGLSIPLDSFDVTIKKKCSKIIRIENEKNPINWNLYNLEVGNNYCAAIVNYGDKKKIISYYIKDISKL